jgi:Ca2+-binding RTX toxin-like protein
MTMIIGSSQNDIIAKGYFSIGVPIPAPDFTGTTDQADIVFAGAGDDIIDGAGGDDMVMGESGDDVLIGGAGDDILDGNDGDDRLIGGDGNDLLIAGAPRNSGDDLAGGTGDDTYVVFQLGAGINEYANAGFDTVLADTPIFGLVGGLQGHIEALTFMGVGDRTGFGNEYDNVITGAGGNDALSGAQGNDTLRGGDGQDVLFGGDGNDLVEGEAGNDSLDGEQGIDILRGGTGDDTIVADQDDSAIDGGANAIVGDQLAYAAGTAAVDLNLVAATARFAGGATQRVTGIENATLTAFNDSFTGTSANNVVSGAAGNDRIGGGNGDDNLAGQDGDDVLDGGAGADILLGGLGNDTYVVDRPTDIASESTGEGIDLVKSTTSLTLGDNLENLTLLGSVDRNGFGNGLNNDIIGNSAVNVLRGLDGRDVLRGGDGDDRLSGDNGQSAEFTVWRAQDGGNGHAYAVIRAPGGIDWNTAADGARALGGTLASITDAAENAFVFNLTDDSRFWSPDNVLGPWLGGAQLVGAGEPGDFIWVNGDQFNFTAWASGEPSNGGGIEDRIQFFQRLTEPGSWNDQAAASTAVVAYVVEFDDPNAFNDSLQGGAGNDILGGNLGADRLTGGLGRDTLTGGSQADVFAFNAVLESTVGAERDIVTDFQGAGVAGGDLIDLRGIDANVSLAGDQAFAFIGVGAFSGAGQVRIVASGGDTIVAGNIDADLAADFEIQLNGVNLALTPLQIGDFLL